MNAPRRRKSAAARRAEIVETAIRLSAEVGPDRVTTQHLADAVGVTQPAIFRHFATKGDIWLAVADHIVSELQDLHAHPHAVTSADPHATLTHIVGHHFAHIAANPAITAILFSRELHAGNDALRHTFANLMQGRREALTSLVEQAQDAGQHRVEMAADDIAHLILAAIQGLSMRWSLEARSFDLVDEGERVMGALFDSLRR